MTEDLTSKLPVSCKFGRFHDDGSGSDDDISSVGDDDDDDDDDGDNDDDDDDTDDDNDTDDSDDSDGDKVFGKSDIITNDGVAYLRNEENR
jgi:hypothetical protein